MRGNKKGLLPKNGGAVGPSMMDKEPPVPERVSIEKAKNGFTITCSGGKGGYNHQPHVATDLEAALEVAKKHLGGVKAGKGEEEDD